MNQHPSFFKRILLSLLVLGPAGMLVFLSSKSCEHKFEELDKFGQLPQYSFQTIDHKEITNSSVKDTVVLYNTIQLSCPDTCGTNLWYYNQIIYQHVVKNQKKLGHIKLISVLTDSSGKPIENLKDMTEILKNYIPNYNPNIWKIVTGDPQQIFDIEHNNKNLIQKDTTYFGGISYQELMLLVDKNNELRMVLNGSQEGMIRTMKQYMALLDKEYDLQEFKKKKK